MAGTEDGRAGVARWRGAGQGGSIAMAVYRRGRVWWYRFTWNAHPIRESTKQTNRRVAEQIEAAHKTSLAKGEVGIRDRVPVPTLKDFAEQDFLPFIEARFKNKPKTLEYYKNGIKNLTGFAPLANSTLDTITSAKIAAFVTKRRESGLQVNSINRQLEVLRRMQKLEPFVTKRRESGLQVNSINRQLEVLRRMQKLATEWGKVNRALPKVEMLPGENHRDRVLTPDEDERYLEGTAAVGEAIQQAYLSALEGIRATMRGQQPTVGWAGFATIRFHAWAKSCSKNEFISYLLVWCSTRRRMSHQRSTQKFLAIMPPWPLQLPSMRA